MAHIVIDTGGLSIEGVNCAGLPPMTPVRQVFEDDAIPPVDIRDTVAAEFARQRGRLQLASGDRVAIGVGSRGIANLAELVRAMVAEVSSLGARPFIVPAMGSHGGATADGQVALLASYGVTEEAVGAPIRSTMETISLGQIDGVDVRVDRIAHTEADAIMTVSRIKPHTSFRGPVESGIHKMLAIGLGNRDGAASLHRGGMSAFTTLIPRVGEYVMDHTAYLGSIAVVENAYHHTADVELLIRNDLPSRETHLLESARRRMAHLPFDDVDVLVVDEVGKDISGAGIDPNVVGRSPGNIIQFEAPRINKIVVLGLTAATHGHPGAIGLADYVTAQVARQVDFSALYTNSITDAEPAGAKFPVVLDDDATAIAVAIQTSHRRLGDPRVVRIRNTLDIDLIHVSSTLLDEVAQHPALDVAGTPVEWSDILACD